MSSKSKKKVKEAPALAEQKSYILFAPDVSYSHATYTDGRVTIVHNENAWVQVIDTGSGYQINDTSPGKGTVTHNIDYALAADLFAALKIFYHNADKRNGEHWTIFQGSKL